MRRLGQGRSTGSRSRRSRRSPQDQQEDPFQVLIATMLSAQTRDAVTHAASTRLFEVARTPRTMAKLPVHEIERLIYPVSFYRHKAVHVKATCEQILSRFGGAGAAHDGGAADAAGRRPQDRESGADPGAPQRATTSASTRTCTASRTVSAGWRRGRRRRPSRRSIAVADRQWWPLINLYLVTWGQNVCRPVYPLCGSCVLAGFVSRKSA